MAINSKGKEVLDLPVAQRLHGRPLGRPFDATVPTPVVIALLPVLLAVGLIVLDVV